jgi:hypothetical protein
MITEGYSEPDCRITNCIFWDNKRGTINDSIAITNSYSSSLQLPVIRHCDIQDGCPVVGLGSDDTHPCDCDSGVINANPNFYTEPEFYDETVGNSYSNTIKVADATKYSIGDVLEYDTEVNAMTVTHIDYGNNIIMFVPHLGETSHASKLVKNWGRYAITKPTKWWSGSDFYGRFEIIGISARLQPGSPCIDTGLDAGIPLDVADLDGDGCVTEEVPFDIDGAPRKQKLLTNTDSVDMGALESSGY